MIVGGKDTGKTTLTQPLEKIYRTMKCPQSDSFCPLEQIRGHDILLWQDFRFNPGHPKKAEVGLRLDIGTWNRLLEGLPTPIGVPKSDGSRSDFTYDENAPLVATGPFQLIGFKDGVPNEKETEQLTCRVKFWHLRRPAPETGLNRGLKPCSICWSRWLLQGAIDWQYRHGGPPDDFLTTLLAKGATGAMPSVSIVSSGQSVPSAQQAEAPARSSTDLQSQDEFFNKLQALVVWHKQGLLSDAEFAQCKQKMCSGL